MRVLLTNARLEDRAGSELYLADVARWLRDHGHHPVIYSSRLGPFAEAVRSESIPVVSDLAELSEAPDVIHAQHHLATMSALATFPLVPTVGFCHGVIPWEESPARHPAIRRYVAVSATTRERLITEGGIGATVIRVMPNFVDLGRFRPRSPLPEQPQRALVFSNSARPGGWLDAVLEACRIRGIEVDLAGLGSGRPLADPERVLPDYDLVFARGRSALEAMAVGVAVVLCDIEGCGPLVTPADFGRLQEGNFGQAVLRESHHGPYLGEQIDRYDPTTADEVSDIVRTTLGRDRVVSDLVGIYHEAIADVGARPHSVEAAWLAQVDYMGWLDRNYPRPVCDSFRALERHAQELEVERDAAQQRADQAEAEAARSHAESARAHAEMVRAQRELRQLRSGFLVRRVLPRLWAWRERVAPTGSRRYRLYRGVGGGLGRPRISTSRRDLGKRIEELALTRGPYLGSNPRLHAITARAYWSVRQGKLGRAPKKAPSRSLQIRRVDSLPPLAWTAIVTSRVCELTHGPRVEVSEAGIFEGVWDGDFAAFEPHLTEFAFGSGAIRRHDGRIQFVCPRQTDEFLYVIRRVAKRDAIVSNSLAFALQVAGLKTSSKFFEEIERSLRARTDQQNLGGLDWAQPLVVDHDDLQLFQISYHGFEIDPTGLPRMIWTAPKSHFRDFTSYRRFVLSTIGALISNGADPRRARRLTPITTISSGYDSVAASALAVELGCKEALTLDVEVYGRPDSGLAPGKALGLEVESFPHVAGRVIPELNFPFGPELAERAYEFIATAGVGDDVTLLPFEPRLPGRDPADRLAWR